MNRPDRVKKNKLVLIFVAAILTALPAYSASKKKNKDSVKIETQKRTFFYKIDSSVLKSVEDGSPEKLKTAMQTIRKRESEYEENEKVLIYVAAEIMKTLWPSEKVSWDVFPVSNANPYVGAIEMAEQGVFDKSTGNTDFLSTLLPALVLYKPASGVNVYDDCEDAARKALSINADSVMANYILACVLEKKNDFQNAQTYIEKAYLNAKSVSEISVAYARILRNSGNIARASEILSGISSDSSNIQVLKQNAFVAFESKDYNLAEQYVARVLQQNPNDLEFVLLRAKILVEKKDYIHAVSLLDVYARQDSTSIDYLILRARVQLDWSKNTAAATETIEKALQLYPSNFDALMLAARVSSVTDSPVAGKYADDLAAKVLEMDPDNQNALAYALQGLVQRENWQEAYAICKKLVANPYASSEIIEKYVQICIKLGKKNEAYETAKKRFEAKPDDEVLLQAYIMAYSQVGNRDVVIRYIDSLMSASSTKIKSFLYYMRSYLQYTDEAALADLRSSLISNPRNSDALFRLYEIYFSKKDYRKAQYYLRQVVAIKPNDSSVKKLNESLTKLIQ